MNLQTFKRGDRVKLRNGQEEILVYTDASAVFTFRLSDRLWRMSDGRRELDGKESPLDIVEILK